MIASSGPFERVTGTLPSQLTGETRYLTDAGNVWTERFPGQLLQSGSHRGRLVNGHIVPEGGGGGRATITIEAAPKKPQLPQREPNRAERRRAKAMQRKAPP